MVRKAGGTPNAVNLSRPRRTSRRLAAARLPAPPVVRAFCPRPDWAVSSAKLTVLGGTPEPGNATWNVADGNKRDIGSWRAEVAIGTSGAKIMEIMEIMAFPKFRCCRWDHRRESYFGIIVVDPDASSIQGQLPARRRLSARFQQGIGQSVRCHARQSQRPQYTDGSCRPDQTLTSAESAETTALLPEDPRFF